MEHAWKDVAHVEKFSNKERFLLSALVFTENNSLQMHSSGLSK